MAYDPALGRRIGRLADLAVLGRHRRGVDDRAAIAVRQGLQGQHAGRRLGDAAEGADEVDLDDHVEVGQREVLDITGVLVAAGGLGRVAGAGAVDQDALLTVGRAGLFKAGVDFGVAGHVDGAEGHAQLFLERGAAIGLAVEVEDGDLDALGDQRADSGLAEAGRTAGDDGGNGGIKLHGRLPGPCVEYSSKRGLAR